MQIRANGKIGQTIYVREQSSNVTKKPDKRQIVHANELDHKLLGGQTIRIMILKRR